MAQSHARVGHGIHGLRDVRASCSPFPQYSCSYTVLKSCSTCPDDPQIGRNVHPQPWPRAAHGRVRRRQHPRSAARGAVRVRARLRPRRRRPLVRDGRPSAHLLPQPAPGLALHARRRLLAQLRRPELLPIHGGLLLCAGAGCARGGADRDLCAEGEGARVGRLYLDALSGSWIWVRFCFFLFH